MQDANSLRERLADLEHEQWISWTTYMLDALGPLLCQPGHRPLEGHPAVELARLRLAGWRRQIATPYAELSEAEKDSDREWADKIIALIESDGR